METYSELINGDCFKELTKIPDDSIDLVITSPPYNANKEYNSYDDNISLSEWTKMIEDLLHECYRIVSDHSRVCINLPWVMGRKPRLHIPQKVAIIGEDAGFYIQAIIVWDKIVTQSTAWGTWLSPSMPVVRSRSEPIIVFQKGIGCKGKYLKGDLDSIEFMTCTENIWRFNGSSNKDHPATFPLELPDKLMKLYTWKGDSILDPFMGIGTTGIASKNNGRNFIGIEIDNKYFNIAKNNIGGKNDKI